MRQYSVVLIGLVVLMGALALRWKLAPASAPTLPVAEAEARALADAEALAGASGSDAKGLEAKVSAVGRSCSALEAARLSPACVALRGKADALLRGGSEAKAQAQAAVQAEVQALRDELAKR